MSPPWMPLYIADYLADTGHLSAAEHGGYLLLIMHYWQAGKLPAEDRQLARICRMSDKEWKTSRATLAEFFDDGWRHHRIEAEIARAIEKTERRAQAGKRGGLAKAKAASQPSNARILPQQNDSNALASSSQPPSVSSDTGGLPPPDYPSDPTERLWKEGVDLLTAMHAQPKEARSNIGRWLKAATPTDVLDAIRKARDLGSQSPVPLVTRLISSQTKPSPGGNDATNLKLAGDRLVERIREREEREARDRPPTLMLS